MERMLSNLYSSMLWNLKTGTWRSHRPRFPRSSDVLTGSVSSKTSSAIDVAWDTHTAGWMFINFPALISGKCAHCSLPVSLCPPVKDNIPWLYSESSSWKYWVKAEIIRKGRNCCTLSGSSWVLWNWCSESPKELAGSWGCCYRLAGRSSLAKTFYC